MVSRRVVERLSLYRRLLSAMTKDGTEHVYSHEIAQLAVVSATQVRRDLMEIGYSGTSHRGYDVARFLASIDAYLDGPTPQDVALVGVGKLGRAVLTFSAVRRPKLTIVAAFDTDPAKIGTRIAGACCLDASRIADVVPACGIRIAIIATPTEVAQDVADLLVSSGVYSIVNFAPVRLQVPEHVFIENVDVTAAVDAATFFAHAQGDIVAAHTSVA